MKIGSTCGDDSLTRVPGLTLSFLEPHAQQTLIYPQNLEYNDFHGEILLHEGIVELKTLLFKKAIIISVIPDIEHVRCGGVLKFQFRFFLFFEVSESGDFFRANGTKALFEVIEKLKET